MWTQDKYYHDYYMYHHSTHTTIVTDAHKHTDILSSSTESGWEGERRERREDEGGRGGEGRGIGGGREGRGEG